jgi:hypothetical protein
MHIRELPHFWGGVGSVRPICLVFPKARQTQTGFLENVGKEVTGDTVVRWILPSG